MSFNKLTHAQAERLALLAEECGEVVQAIGKILRHGYRSRHPASPPLCTNQWDLANEIGDLTAAIEMMLEARDIDPLVVDEGRINKRSSVGRYLHHQKRNTP